MRLSLTPRELKKCIDLAEFARGYTRLRPCGRQLVGLCPFHPERHPSFYVHPERRIWFCFGCNRGGDVFDLVMRANGCEFRRALEIIAEFSEEVARTSEPRSGSRFGASEGAKPLSPPKAGAAYSPFIESLSARILAALEATNRRLRAIEQTNRAASAALATACEPDRGASLLLEETE